MVLFGMLAGLLAVTGIALGAMGPIVRARIQKEADRRELDIEVGGVRPGFFTIALKDVHVRPRKVPGLEARLARIENRRKLNDKGNGNKPTLRRAGGGNNDPNNPTTNSGDDRPTLGRRN